MRKLLIPSLVFACLVTAGQPATATEPQLDPGPWNLDLSLGLNLNQSAFTANWQGGDKGTYNWVLSLDFRAERQFSSKFNWTNTLDVDYGERADQEAANDAVRPDDREYKWTSPSKSTDQILLESTTRWTLRGHVDPYVMFRYDSQFVNDADLRGQLLFTPIRLSLIGGITRVIQKTEKSEVLTRIGFGLNQNLTKSFTDSQTDETDWFSNTDGGLEWLSDAILPFGGDKFEYKTRLLVSYRLFYSQSQNLTDIYNAAVEAGIQTGNFQDFWQIPDVDWRNTLTASVNDWLSFKFFIRLNYNKYDESTAIDPDIDVEDNIGNIVQGIRKKTQWKQTLALSLTYRFF